MYHGTFESTMVQLRCTMVFFKCTMVYLKRTVVPYNLPWYSANVPWHLLYRHQNIQKWVDYYINNGMERELSI